MSPSNSVSHLIKKENVANVPALRLSAYYPAGTSGSGRVLQLRYGIDGKKCEIANFIRNGPGVVWIEIRGATETRSYPISMANVCDNLGTPRNNVEGFGAGWQNNRFFGNYALPNNLIYEPTLGLNRVDIRIRYGNDVIRGGSDQNSVNFIALVNGGGRLGYDVALANEFGLRSAYFGEDRRRDVSVSSEFGLPCSETRTTFPVTLYDPDRSAFGDIYMYVTEDGVRLPQSRYGSSNSGENNTLVAWRGGSRQAWLAVGESNVSSVVWINGASPTKDYAFHIVNEATDGKINPNRNVLSMRIPYDSIYADIDCNVELTPRAYFDESSVEAGQQVDAKAYIDNGAAVTAANYRRDFWYSNSSDPDDPPAQSLRGLTANVAANPGRTTLPTGPPDWSTTVSGNFGYLCTRLIINSPGDRRSSAQCIPIGKYPSLAVKNGDARTGGAVPRGSCNVTGGKGSIIGHQYGRSDRGSLADYGVLARLDITEFGSTNISPSGVGTNQLYFGAGTAYSPSLGSAANGYFYRNRLGVEQILGHCLPNVSSVYPSGAISTTVPANQTRTLPAYSSTQTFNFAQNGSGQTSIVELPGAALAPNQRLSVRINGPADCSTGAYIVRLTGNITRTASSVDTVPWYSLITTGSCVRVVIQDNVTALYGLYASEGSIATCMGENRLGFDGTEANGYPGEPNTPLNATVCNQQLKVSGVVISGTDLYSYRTFGEGLVDSPAETFELDPVFTISDYNRARLSPTFQTANQLELPPRY